jgi:hypothetical protein
MKSEFNLYNGRKPGESFNSYKTRQKMEKKQIKIYLKGKYFWQGGTYVRTDKG